MRRMAPALARPDSTGGGVVLLAGHGPGSVAGWDGPVQRAAVLDRSGPSLPPATHVLVCPPGVELVDGAAQAIEEMLVHDPDIDLAYFDSVDTSPPEPETCLRPGFSPDRLLAQQYLGPVLLVARRLLAAHRDAGGTLHLPPRLAEVQELADRARIVAHLPRILYRSADPVGGVETVADARPAPPGGPDGAPLVSIIMPTRGGERTIDGRRVTLCLNAIDRLVERTEQARYEVIMVLTPGTPGELMTRLLAVLENHPVDRRPVLRFREDRRRFNFADACNLGAVAARGDVLVFLNDDTEVVAPDWLDRLATWATQPEVGAVGARLHYGDGTIQHTGIWSRGGHPYHRYEGFRPDHPGHRASLAVPQNCLAVTGACLAVEAAKFDRAGGFCPEFPSSYNDVDLCLKLDALGHRTVVDPAVVLTHYEASTRDPGIEDWELALLHRRWRRVLIADPYDNPGHGAPLADEFPTPEPDITLRRQQAGQALHPARIWTRPEPVPDLIDLERLSTDPGPYPEEAHVL
jgi:O-antigen biosynthesis protein